MKRNQKKLMFFNIFPPVWIRLTSSFICTIETSAEQQRPASFLWFM
jgi:hypothetical protein